MAKVVALYRYPVKGFAPQACEALTVLHEGRIAGDRVLAFRFANAGVAGGEWGRKQECVVLMNTPGLARLAVRFDHRARQLRIERAGTLLAEGGLDEAGRDRLAAALADYVLALDENPLAGHPERLPLKLVGDGTTPRYQDNVGGHATLHSRASLAAVAAAARDPDLSEVRFRSNIAIDGVPAWAEQGWMGRRLRIGAVEFEVVRRKVRCLAIHANPATGSRDLRLLQILMREFDQPEPTFAIGMVSRGAGGTIRLGDEVRLLDED
jgi:uncharacterized protein YcbX